MTATTNAGDTIHHGQASVQPTAVTRRPRLNNQPTTGPPMNASKEEARKAKATAEKLSEHHSQVATTTELDQLLEFCRAAERKLPTESAYTSDKNRK